MFWAYNLGHFKLKNQDEPLPPTISMMEKIFGIALHVDSTLNLRGVS